LQSPFEFPRQQKEDKVNDPGVMQFKSTQQLLNPSQTFRPPQSSATFRAPLDPSRTFRPPQSSRTFRPPQSSPTFRPPQSSPTFQNPQSSPTFRNPQSSPTFRKPESPFARYLPKNLLKEARKENEDLHVQIAKLKLENAEKDQTIAQLQLEQKTDQGRREKLQSQVKEMQKEAKNHRRREKRALIPKEVKSFSDYGKTQQKKIVQKYWENILQEYDEDSAKTLVQKVYKNYAKEEIPSLTALETLHIIKTSNLSYNSFKKIKHELQLHGSFPKIFASMHAVNQERQKIHKLYETECFTAKMKDTIEGQLKDVTVIVLKWIEQVLQQRLDDTCDAGNYVNRFFKGEEELWYAITGDKGGDLSKLAIIPGNTNKRTNSAFNLIYLSMFGATDSQFNVDAAWKRLSPQLQAITHLRVTQNGVSRMVPVRFFKIFDYKLQKGEAGIRDGRCGKPCVKCISPADTNYKNFDFNALHVPRVIEMNK
jgi:hypothetical protein